MDLHVCKLLLLDRRRLLLLHHQILYRTFIDFDGIGRIHAYFGSTGLSQDLLGLPIRKLLRLRDLIGIVDSLVAFTNVGVSIHLGGIGLLLLQSLLLFRGRLLGKDHTALAVSTVFVPLILLRLAALSILLLPIGVVD